MGGERRIGELPADEVGPEKGFESPERVEERHGYTRSETQLMGDGQLDPSLGRETNPEGSHDISNYEFQRNERPAERAAGETTAPTARGGTRQRTDRE